MRRTAILREISRMREEVANLRAERPPPGMVEVRYAGVSGMLRQAREDAQRDEHGNLVPRHIVSLDKPRPASGAAAMLWDAMAAVRKRKEERAAAGLLPLSGRC